MAKINPDVATVRIFVGLLAKNTLFASEARSERERRVPNVPLAFSPGFIPAYLPPPPNSPTIAFAIALLTFGIHALGDVPSPIIIGLVKDTLAPACSINSDGEFDDLDECRSQKDGIKLTLFTCVTWMIWCVLFTEVARRLAKGKANLK